MSANKYVIMVKDTAGRGTQTRDTPYVFHTAPSH
jgi:hypothetical protein